MLHELVSFTRIRPIWIHFLLTTYFHIPTKANFIFSQFHLHKANLEVCFRVYSLTDKIITQIEMHSITHTLFQYINYLNEKGQIFFLYHKKIVQYTRIGMN